MGPEHSPLTGQFPTTQRVVYLCLHAMLWRILISDLPRPNSTHMLSTNQILAATFVTHPRHLESLRNSKHMSVNERQLSLTGPLFCQTALFFASSFLFRAAIYDTLNHAEKTLELSIRLIAPLQFFFPSFVHGLFLPRKFFT